MSACAYTQRGKSPKYSNEKIYPVLAQKCNQWEGIILDKALFAAPETIGGYGEERFLQDGDIVVNSTGTGTLGRVGLFHKSVLGRYNCIVADSHITVIRASQYFLPQFLYYFFLSSYQQKVIEDSQSGSTNQKELYTEAIKNFLVPTPPYKEQTRIASLITALSEQLSAMS